MIRPMRLGNRAMKEEKARKLLAECEYALFTTVDEEGAPHTVPVSPVVLGNALYFIALQRERSWTTSRRILRFACAPWGAPRCCKRK